MVTMKIRNREAKAYFDEKIKRLHIEESKLYFVPSYAYYLCDWIAQKHDIRIETVQFVDSRVYKVSELRGRHDWSEINEPK